MRFVKKGERFQVRERQYIVGWGQQHRINGAILSYEQNGKWPSTDLEIPHLVLRDGNEFLSRVDDELDYSEVAKALELF